MTAIDSAMAQPTRINYDSCQLSQDGRFPFRRAQICSFANCGQPALRSSGSMTEDSWRT